MGVAMVLRPELRVSVDVGCHRHSEAVGLTSGELLEEFDIDHRPEGFADFFSRIHLYDISRQSPPCNRPELQCRPTRPHGTEH